MEKIFSRKKIYSPFKPKIAITQPIMKIWSSVFCKHPIFDSTQRFFKKKWVLWEVSGDTFYMFKVPKFFFKGLLEKLK